MGDPEVEAKTKTETHKANLHLRITFGHFGLIAPRFCKHNEINEGG